MAIDIVSYEVMYYITILESFIGHEFYAKR